MKNIKNFFFGILVAIIFILSSDFLIKATWGDASSFDIFTIEYLLLLLSYFIWTISLGIILEKMNYEHYWLAPIPIGNFFVLIDFLDKPMWWLVYLMIPFFNIIILIILAMNFLATLEKHPANVILFLIPIISQFYCIYLAIKTERIKTESNTLYSETSTYKI